MIAMAIEIGDLLRWLGKMFGCGKGMVVERVWLLMRSGKE
jgi:hypothetical protein